MSDGKGKGRAAPDEDGKSSKADEPSQNSSMLARVAASATGLTRSAFAPPNSSEISGHAAAAILNSGKGQSPAASGGASTAWAESSKTSQPLGPQAGGSASFRVGHNEEHVRQSENEFSEFLDGIDSFTPSEYASGGQVAGGTFEETWSRSQTGQPQTPVARTVAEQEGRDGEEVLAILSDPATGDEQFEAPSEDDEDYDWGLSSEQLSHLRAMTKDILPPPEPHGNVSINDPLNLVPRPDVIAGSQLMGQPDVIAMEQWRDQWEGVLTRYTDEVWGGLLPLVKEARREVETMKEGALESSTELKALKRLEAILGHLQKR
jgi:hypothetical protein